MFFIQLLFFSGCQDSGCFCFVDVLQNGRGVEKGEGLKEREQWKMKEKGKEKWMPSAGLSERGLGGDEILPYLSRQLHFVDFYLSWQRVSM